MADEGTLATTAQVLLAIGEGASTAQVLEVNTNIWIKYAEAEISVEMNRDVVGNIGDVGTNFLQYLALISANRAAWWSINQDQSNWGLATTQSKLNVLLQSWKAGLNIIRDKDRVATMGL